MDFTVFDHSEHMTALTWLGRKDWMLYQDIPAQRAISARPRKLVIKPRQPIEPGPEAPIIVGQKEYDRYPADMWKVLREIMNVLEFDVVGTLWYNTLAKALAGGPKIFRPTALQCEALQHAEARYAFKDYKQPYPVITLEIPEEYRQVLKDKYGIEESPRYVIVNHDDKNRFITVSAFYNKGNIITHITPDRAEYDTIESSLVRNRDRRQDSIQEVAGRFVMPGNPTLQGSDIKDASVTYTIHPGRGNPQPPAPPEMQATTPTQLPVPEPGLQVGQRIEIIQADESPVGPGTQGKVTKVVTLGSNIIQIDAVTDDEQRFSIIVPPDEYKIVESGQ